jgi:hypothetical protein
MDEKPRFCLRNEDIKGFTGKTVKDFSIGDEVTLTIKCRVNEVSQDEHYDYGNSPVALTSKPEKEEDRKKKVDNQVGFEVIGGGEKEETAKPLFKPYRSRM